MTISEERWKVRTRMLEERVNTLAKQLASEKENTARLRIEQQDCTAKVQSLEADLRAERERCHKLSVSLSSCRRTIHQYKENLCLSSKYLSVKDHPYYHNTSSNTQEYCSYQAICDCMVNSNHFIIGNPKDSSVRMNHTNNVCNHSQHYMGIRPARMNLRSSLPRKIKSNYAATRPISTNHSTKHGNDHSNTELLLAHRLLQLIDDNNQVISNHCASNKLDSAINCVHCGQLIKNQAIFSSTKEGIGGSNYGIKNSIPSTTEDETGSKKAENLAKTRESEDKIKQKDNNKITETNRELRTEDDIHCDSNNDKKDKNYNKKLIKENDNYINLEALKEENEALRKALLSGKIMEINELEKQLQDVNHKINQPNPTYMCESPDGKNIMDWPIQPDPVKYLDTVKTVEDEISGKRISLLGLEGGLATQLSSLTTPEANYNPNYHEDLRHLMKALARDVVLLRKENEWLKTRVQV